jgi:putative transposase
MAHTYTSNFIHCIFSTKERKPLISADRLPELCAYFSGVAKGEGLVLLLAGGTANHVHLLFSLPANVALATAVQKIKGSSSHWMGNGFSWQQGYGAFSVSPSQLPVVKAYIAKQEERSRPGNYMVGSCGPQRIGYLACLAA